MNDGHVGAYAVDAVIWIFLLWAAVVAFCSRKAAVTRRRARRQMSYRQSVMDAYHVRQAALGRTSTSTLVHTPPPGQPVTPAAQHVVVVVPAQKRRVS